MTSGRHFPSLVTTLIVRRVRPGMEAAYEEWTRGLTEIARRYPGFQGVNFIGPRGGAPAEYITVFSFDCTERLEQWMRSPERQQSLREAERMTVEDPEIQTLTGLERWFILPDRGVTQAPPRWKMALLTTVGVYPLLLVLNYGLDPWIGGLAVHWRLLAVLVAGIPIMTWGIMPRLTRLFFRWLYPGTR